MGWNPHIRSHSCASLVSSRYSSRNQTISSIHPSRCTLTTGVVYGFSRTNCGRCRYASDGAHLKPLSTIPSLFVIVVVSVAVTYIALPPILEKMGAELFLTWIVLIGIPVGIVATQISNMQMRQRTSMQISISETAVRTVTYWIAMMLIAIFIILAITVLE